MSNPNLGQKTYRMIKEQIIDLTLKPGDKISETEISKRFDISRTPAREALVRLAEEKLVESIPYKGTFISKLSFKNITDALFIRQTLECKIIRELISKITEINLDVCYQNLDKQKKAMEEKNLKDFFTLDEQFHRLFYTLSGHERVYDAVQDIFVHYNRVRYLTIHLPKHENIYQEHLNILVALKEGDENKALSCLHIHLNNTPFEKEKLLNDFHNFFID